MNTIISYKKYQKNFLILLVLLLATFNININASIHTISGSHYVVGNHMAPVSVFIYTDFSCGACAYFHRETLPRLKYRYRGNSHVKFIMKNFVMSYPSLYVSKYVFCKIRSPQEHEKIQNEFFKNQSKWVFTRVEQRYKDDIEKIIQNLGIDQDYLLCMHDEALEKKLRIERDNMLYETGLIATPAVYVNNKAVLHSYNKISEAIDLAIQEEKEKQKKAGDLSSV